MGLSLLAYAVNLFIFSIGSLAINQAPIIVLGRPANLENYTDPMPQALVLTAIVISFATTALFLVLLLGSCPRRIWSSCRCCCRWRAPR